MEMAVAVRHAGLRGRDPGLVAGGAGVAERGGEIAMPVAAEDLVGPRPVKHDTDVVRGDLLVERMHAEHVADH